MRQSSFGGSPSVLARAQAACSPAAKSRSRKLEPKFTHTAPPFCATAFNIASVMFRGTFASSRAEECDAMTGFRA